MEVVMAMLLPPLLPPLLLLFRLKDW